MAQAPDAGCRLPSEPKGIPAAIEAAITGPADKTRHAGRKATNSSHRELRQHRALMEQLRSV
jgi:hypothetical protein